MKIGGITKEETLKIIEAEEESMPKFRTGCQGGITYNRQN